MSTLNRDDAAVLIQILNQVNLPMNQAPIVLAIMEKLNKIQQLPEVAPRKGPKVVRKKAESE